jgi:predicted transcriptional regulator
MLKLKPEQQQLLDRAARSGMSAEEVLDQAFAVVREQYRNESWMHSEAVAAQIAQGFAQAERGELIDGSEAAHLLAERRAKRQIA